MADAAKKEAVQAAGDANSSAPAKPKADILSLLVLVFALVNLGAIGALGFYMNKLWTHLAAVEESVAKVQQSGAAESEASVHEKSVGKELEPAPLGTLYPIDSFLVNVSSDQGAKFLQAQMELELADPSAEEEVTKKKAAIRDAIIVLLSSRSYKELREPAGMKRLRADIVRSVNQLLTNGRVKEVFFTQFHFN